MALSLLTLRTCFQSRNTPFIRKNFHFNTLQKRMASAESAAVPWHAAFPAPRNNEPGTMTRGVLLEMLKNGQSAASQDYILVDLRRVDHEGGTIHGSINLPAQSLYPTIPTVYNIFKSAGISKVIWYCSSSRGRGTRAAGWFSDYIDEKGDKEMKSLILFEGVKGWAQAGGEYVEWMDDYDKAAWESK